MTGYVVIYHVMHAALVYIGRDLFHKTKKKSNLAGNGSNRSDFIKFAA